MKKTCSKCKISQDETEFYRHRAQCKKCKRKYQKYYQENNIVRYEEYQKEYKAANKSSRAANQKEYHRNKMESDPVSRTKRNIRHRFRQALKGGFKYGSSVKLLGCTVQEVWDHLCFLLLPGMTPDHHPLTGNSKNGWHIDHIVPLDSFDLEDPIQLAKAWHYTNLQPLWAIDNFKKGSKTGTLTLNQCPVKLLSTTEEITMALTIKDIRTIQDFARKRFVGQPARARLEETGEALSPSELATIANIEATLNFLSEKGVLQNADRFGVEFRTIDSEVIDAIA